jgi:hypothetical protein
VRYFRTIDAAASLQFARRRQRREDDVASGKVYSVDEVRARITRAQPAHIAIHAIGRVTTTGWGVGTLAKYIYLAPPADGVQEFDFYAQLPEPSTIALNVLTPISAHSELPNVDVDNYWGRARPLKGVRVHAVANAKIVNVVPRAEALRLSARMSPRATVAYVGPDGGAEIPGYEEDIKPLFRPRDVNAMITFGQFNLHSYDDVKARAQDILARLKDDMPCDGPWPETDIAKFQAWMDGGMQP